MHNINSQRGGHMTEQSGGGEQGPVGNLPAGLMIEACLQCRVVGNRQTWEVMLQASTHSVISPGNSSDRRGLFKLCSAIPTQDPMRIGDVSEDAPSLVVSI